MRDNRDDNMPLTFISFKISVPVAIEAIVSAPHFWPTGVSIKPFSARVSSNNQNFLLAGRKRRMTPSPRQRVAIQTNHQQQTISPLVSPLPQLSRIVQPQFNNRFPAPKIWNRFPAPANSTQITQVASTMV